MKVAIIGGGPSGLYLAILLKRWGVAKNITVYEQNPKGATYGFGVGLAEGALKKLEQADKESHDAIQRKLYATRTQDIETPNGIINLNFPIDAGMITRLTLLEVLEGQCDQLGVVVKHDAYIEEIAQFDTFDLVVAADGANSVVRKFFSEKFNCTRRYLGNRFAWYGVGKVLPSALRFRRHGGGIYIAHYYPYTEKMSTFLLEVDAQTWEAEGFGERSDAERQVICEDLFADVLEGATLIENKSNWSRFLTVENDCWVTDRVALIGDAQYRGHFSIGSGTRLAMEDSIALATALRQTPAGVKAALATYEAARRPSKETLMTAAERSYTWYDNIRDYIDLPLLEFGYTFLTRTGRMPEERLRLILPDFMAQYDEYKVA